MQWLYLLENMYFLNHFNLVINFGLVVLIWIIQILHYPSFLFIDKNQFQEFQLFHMRKISYVVMPLMILELSLALILVYFNPGLNLYLLSLIIVLHIWICTFKLSVPLHSQLESEGFNKDIIYKLIQTNWPRTWLWSFKTLVLLLIIN